MSGNYDQHVNFGYTSVAVAPNPANSGTSFVVTGGDTSKFPTPPFNVTVWPAGVPPTSINAEIVRVTSVNSGTDSWAFTRTQENSSARTIQIGDQVSNAISQKVITDIENAVTQKTVITVGTASGADYVATGTNDNIVINNAINAVNVAGGGIVYIRQGTYNITGRITNLSNVRVIGFGKGVTILQGGVASDYTFYNLSAISHFSIENLTIDIQNGSNASGLRLQQATSCALINVEIKNGASGGWLAVLGTPNSATDGITNTDNKIIDCDFDTHAGSLEMLLIFNAESTQVIRPKFINKSTSGPGFGLWQKCYDTKIINPTFRNNVGGYFYYSVTVENTQLVAPYFENSGGITGANTSDNGNFGLTQAQNLEIINPIMIGGSNTTQATAIQLGAINNVTVTNPIIKLYQAGIRFNTGNNANTTAVTNFSISGGQIYNNNASNNFSILHPGISFTSIGGSLYGTITNTEVYDNQGSPTQAYPIVFDGAFTWDNISIVNNRLSKTGSGTSIALNNSAVLGSNLQIFNNQDYSGTNPAQIVLANATTSVVGEVQLTNDFGGTATAPTVVATHLASALPVNQGGTGSTTQNFVDLSTNQNPIAGLKIFSSQVQGNQTGGNKISFADNDNHTWEGDGTGYWRFRNAWTSNNQGFVWFAAPASGSVAERLRLTGGGDLLVGTSTDNSVLTIAGPIATALASKSSNYTITATDSVILASGTTTITLPTAVGITGRQYTIKKTDASGTNVTIATTSSQNIDSATTYILSVQYQSIAVVSDGTQWWIV